MYVCISKQPVKSINLCTSYIHITTPIFPHHPLFIASEAVGWWFYQNRGVKTPCVGVGVAFMMVVGQSHSTGWLATPNPRGPTTLNIHIDLVVLACARYGISILSILILFQFYMFFHPCYIFTFQIHWQVEKLV